MSDSTSCNCSPTTGSSEERSSVPDSAGRSNLECESSKEKKSRKSSGCGQEVSRFLYVSTAWSSSVLPGSKKSRSGSRWLLSDLTLVAGCSSGTFV